MTKMDPYCRIKIGNSIYETPSHMNGAKSPRWDKIFLAPIDPEIAEISVDVYDEVLFILLLNEFIYVTQLCLESIYW